jgi:hypothetical protein
MPQQMDEGYFEEKRAVAGQSLAAAVNQIEATAALIESMRCSMPDLIDSEKVHNNLQYASTLLDNARRDFEKARWASAKTELEFEDWLNACKGSDLATPKKISIKQASPELIENAFADAISEILGSKYKASLTKIDFTHLNQLGSTAVIPIELQISLANRFPGAI